MRLNPSPVPRRRLAACAAPIVAGVLLCAAAPAVAQTGGWDPSSSAMSRCQQELEYRMGRDVGGRQPNASIDERRAQTQRQSNGDVRVRGNGRYMRDYNDRGRDFTFDCTYSSRNNGARATYTGRGGDWGGGYPPPDPGFGRPPSGGYPPSGRVFFSGGIVSRGSNKCLDVEGRSNRDAANVQQWSCSGGSNQKWDVIDLGRGSSRSSAGEQQGADSRRAAAATAPTSNNAATTAATISGGASNAPATTRIASSACRTTPASTSRARSATTARTSSRGAAAAAPIRPGFSRSRI